MNLVIVPTGILIRSLLYADEKCPLWSQLAGRSIASKLNEHGTALFQRKLDKQLGPYSLYATIRPSVTTFRMQQNSRQNEATHSK